jgi:hypothetical protein
MDVFVAFDVVCDVAFDVACDVAFDVDDFHYTWNMHSRVLGNTPKGQLLQLS